MAYGVELREPFLDHKLVEFAFAMPSEFKIQHGVGKYMLRELLRPWCLRIFPMLQNAHSKPLSGNGWQRSSPALPKKFNGVKAFQRSTLV